MEPKYLENSGYSSDPVHPEAISWLQKLNPRDLEIHLRKHGVSGSRVENTVKALARLQLVFANVGDEQVSKYQIPEIADGAVESGDSGPVSTHRSEAIRTSPPATVNGGGSDNVSENTRAREILGRA